jgi:ArsR family transcriptional regulator, arsenate/arsenite/antimonite-responsive transcriptional repressor
MNLEDAAIKLEALGNSTRLQIFRELVGSGPEGSTVGEIREAIDIPASTLSHHIAKLVNAGLMIQDRQSRSLICTVDHSSMDELMEFLVNNCCTEEWYIQPG